MKRFLSLALIALTLVSCNHEPSLQKYFVENSEKKEFISLDVSPSILNVKPETLTPDQQKALASFKKINVIAFKVNETNRTEYASEAAKVKLILKDKKYQELMHYGSGKDGGSISYVGEDDNIDEFVLFANRKENGFAVVRVLGDNMTPNSIFEMMSVLKNSKGGLEQLKPLQDFIQK